MALLDVDALTVQFRRDHGWITAVEDVGFTLQPKEALGIVGESGSGKSVTALALLGLHPPGATRIPSGSVRFAGQDLLRLPPRALRRIRGGDIAMIFQDPMSSLNPVLTVADQITETLRLHQGLDRIAARKRAIALLDMVRIPDAARRIDEYPNKMSGGQRQRVMIAIAIACEPKLLIADEPTTALDVTIQAQIIDLLRDLQQRLGMSVILISHDLGIIAEFAQRVMVMYAGRVVETAPAAPIFAHPLHPYTERLLAAIPPIDADVHRLPTIPGSIPDPEEHIAGCRFHVRCPYALDVCAVEPPVLLPAAKDRFSRCPPRLPHA
jgi:peptide/nickel transport system ATP-binding protein